MSVFLLYQLTILRHNGASIFYQNIAGYTPLLHTITQALQLTLQLPQNLLQKHTS